MRHIITTAHPKGGVGKSTTTAELAAYLWTKKRKTLVIELDKNRTLSRRLGFPARARVDVSAYDYIEGAATADEVAVESPALPGIHVMQARTSDYRLTRSVVPALRARLAKEKRWDYAIIDTPGHTTEPTLAALVAADIIVVPAMCAYEVWDGLDELEDFRAGEVARLRPDAAAEQRTWYIPIYSSPIANTVANRDLEASLRRRYGKQVTNSVHNSVTATDSFLAEQPISVYDPTCTPATDYQAAAKTILPTR